MKFEKSNLQIFHLVCERLRYMCFQIKSYIDDLKTEQEARVEWVHMPRFVSQEERDLRERHKNKMQDYYDIFTALHSKFYEHLIYLDRKIEEEEE